MPEVPKIVHDRLRAAALAGAHPEADVLAAFAEQALSATEREGVVVHLAACRDCREVLALSIPALETVARPMVAAEQIPAAASNRTISHPPRWLSWPNLHWAAAAAGVVVVASVLMLRHSKQAPSMVDIVNEQAEQSRPAAPQSNPVLPEAAKANAETGSSAPARIAQADESRTRRQTDGNFGPVASSPVIAQPSAGTRDYAPLVDSKRSDATPTDKLSLKTAPGQSSGAVVGGASEQVEVTSGAAAVSTDSAKLAPAAPAQIVVMGRNEAPLEIKKAKPPNSLKEEAPPAKTQALEVESQDQAAAGLRYSSQPNAMKRMVAKDMAAQWSFVAGVLRRSLDGGATWQTALQLKQPLLSFGSWGNEVWASGHSGMLFHSIDRGATWTQVRPATKVESLTADIIAVEMNSATDIRLTTDTHQSWFTSDGGRTWEKK